MRIVTDGFETDTDTKGGLCPAKRSRDVMFRSLTHLISLHEIIIDNLFILKIFYIL